MTIEVEHRELNLLVFALVHLLPSIPRYKDIGGEMVETKELILKLIEQAAGQGGTTGTQSPKHREKEGLSHEPQVLGKDFIQPKSRS